MIKSINFHEYTRKNDFFTFSFSCDLDLLIDLERLCDINVGLLCRAYTTEKYI